MKEFSSETFFCLNDFMHKELFLQIDFVWKALQNLEIYLSKQNLGNIGQTSELLPFTVSWILANGVPAKNTVFLGIICLKVLSK